MNQLAVNHQQFLNVLESIKTAYPQQQKTFVEYLAGSGTGLTEHTIKGYLSWIASQLKTTPQGRQIRYSVSWYNAHKKAVKAIVKELLNKSPSLSVADKYQIDKYLDSIKMDKQKIGIAKADRLPTEEEIQTLVKSADIRLSLMIQFLVQSGARISEMLSAKVANARRNPQLTYVQVVGKGNKVRDIRVKSTLYDAIQQIFKGKDFLFEHNGKPYSRVSVCNRLVTLSSTSIGKHINPHMLRHYRATVLSDKLGISKACTELGHSSIATTKLYYDHSKATEDEILASL